MACIYVYKYLLLLVKGQRKIIKPSAEYYSDIDRTSVVSEQLLLSRTYTLLNRSKMHSEVVILSW